HTDAARGTRRRKTFRSRLERLGPGHGTQLTARAVLTTHTHERLGQAIGGLLPREREAVLVGDPLLVDDGVLTRKTTQHGVAALVDADLGAVRVVLGDRGRRDEVERARAEAVGRRGERTDRADLDRVAREVRG